MQKINESNSWLFDKINKIRRLLTQLTEEGRTSPELAESKMNRETLQQTQKKFRIL